MRTLAFSTGDCIYPVTAMTGTVSIDAAGLVTGVGTLFLTELGIVNRTGFAKAKYVFIDDSVYEVLSITSNTSMRLKQDTYVVVAGGTIALIPDGLRYVSVLVNEGGRVLGVMPSSTLFSTTATPFLIEDELGIPPFSFAGDSTCIVR